jgi:hypothetical protein
MVRLIVFGMDDDMASFDEKLRRLRRLAIAINASYVGVTAQKPEDRLKEHVREKHYTGTVVMFWASVHCMQLAEDELLALEHKGLFEDNIQRSSNKEKGEGLLYIFKHYTASHATSKVMEKIRLDGAHSGEHSWYHNNEVTKEDKKCFMLVSVGDNVARTSNATCQRAVRPVKPWKPVPLPAVVFIKEPPLIEIYKKDESKPRVFDGMHMYSAPCTYVEYYLVDADNVRRLAATGADNNGDDKFIYYGNFLLPPDDQADQIFHTTKALDIWLDKVIKKSVVIEAEARRQDEERRLDELRQLEEAQCRKDAKRKKREAKRAKNKAYLAHVAKQCAAGTGTVVDALASDLNTLQVRDD